MSLRQERRSSHQRSLPLAQQDQLSSSTRLRRTVLAQTSLSGSTSQQDTRLLSHRQGCQCKPTRSHDGCSLAWPTLSLLGNTIQMSILPSARSVHCQHSTAQQDRTGSRQSRVHPPARDRFHLDRGSPHCSQCLLDSTSLPGRSQVKDILPRSSGRLDTHCSWQRCSG